MKKGTKLEDTIVLALAVTATLSALYVNTNWFNKGKINTEMQRERCYGIASAGNNDCATAKHSCANQSTDNKDPKEYVMVPAGLCKRLSGGILGE